MPRWDDTEDEDWDDEDDLDDPDLIPCPHCRHEIFEDSPRCPHCGRYLSREDAPPERKPWWVILGVIVCLYVVWRWMF
jgi:hypothetical protein